MLVDVQDMRCVCLWSFFFFFFLLSFFGQEDGPVSYLWIEACPFAARKFSACGWPSGLYKHHIFSNMQRDCIRKGCPPGPFFLIQNTMIKWFRLCWLPWSCSLHLIVNNCPTLMCLRFWNKWVSPLPLVATALWNGPWFVRGLTPQNQAT